MPIGYATEDLRWTVKKIIKVIAFLTENCFLRFDSSTNTMLIIDALKFQTPDNENQAKACLRRIAYLPRTELLSQFHALAKQHCHRNGASQYAKIFYKLLDEQLGEPLGEPLTEDLRQPLRPLHLHHKPIPQISNLKAKQDDGGIRDVPKCGSKPDDRMDNIADTLKVLSPSLRRTFSEHMEGEA